MYKTIRQGENSLQYTILPQQDEGRPGGLAVGHRKNGGGTRKRSILAYIGLFFVCAIITFAILIPLLVTSDLTPTAWFYRNQKVRDGKLLLGNVVPVKQSENHIVRGTPLRTVLLSSATVSTSTSTTTVAPTTSTMPAEHNGPLWSDALSVTEFQKLYKGDESIERTGDVLPLEQFPATTTTPRPFVVRDHQTTPGQQQSGTGNLLLARGRQRITASMSSTTVRPIPGQMQTQQQQQRSYPKHFSLQKHEKLTGADIPIQQQETKSIQVDTNREDMEKAHQNWLEAHWSYVDPYLRWKVSSNGRDFGIFITGNNGFYYVKVQ